MEEWKEAPLGGQISFKSSQVGIDDCRLVGGFSGMATCKFVHHLAVVRRSSHLNDAVKRNKNRVGDK